MTGGKKSTYNVVRKTLCFTSCTSRDPGLKISSSFGHVQILHSLSLSYAELSMNSHLGEFQLNLEVWLVLVLKESLGLDSD